jgi:hypothetical protein
MNGNGVEWKPARRSILPANFPRTRSASRIISPKSLYEVSKRQLCDRFLAGRTLNPMARNAR